MQRYSYPVLCVFLFISCKKEATVQPPPPKDPRTYTWTVDTISSPGSFQTAMRDIWGSAPNDVYIVGHNERWYGKMFHYDGSSWQPVDLGRIAGAIDLAAIHGFAFNNIFAAGERAWVSQPSGELKKESLIIHFDGNMWVELTQVHGSELQSIGGTNPDDLWAGGSFGQSLYHIVNKQPQLIGNDSSLQFADFAGINPSSVYAISYRVSRAMDSIYYYSLFYDGNSWHQEDTWFEAVNAPPARFGSYSLWVDRTSSKVYSSGIGGIFIKSPTGWQQALSADGIIKVYGSSSSNIFGVGFARDVYHYNGNDWQQLGRLSLMTNSLYYSGVWTDGQEAFILGHDASKTYILHGK